MKNDEMLMIPCIIESFGGRQDKTLKIVISTQELPPATISKLSEMWLGGYGIMAFKREEFSYDDQRLLGKIKIDSLEMGRKTYSQRMRDVMYRMYQNNPEGHDVFDNYYAFKMEKIISYLKSKLD